MSRKWLLSTTTLTGVASALMLSGPVSAADLVAPARVIPAGSLDLPAVSGVNAKFDGRFGSYFGDTLAVGAGALSVPVGQRFGVQVGGFAGTVGGDLFLQGEGQAFWRDPRWGLFGVYAAYSHLAPGGGLGALGVTTVGGQSELYLGNFTLSGVVGYQWINGGTSVDNSFFTDLKAALYLTPDLKVYGGYRYDQKVGQGVVGGEWQLPLNTSVGVTAFGEGRFANAGTEAWGGIRLYFGKRRTLIDRHRLDDPQMIMIVPNRTVQYVGSAPPPPAP
jgi:hypothetical protein